MNPWRSVWVMEILYIFLVVRVGIFVVSWITVLLMLKIVFGFSEGGMTGEPRYQVSRVTRGWQLI